jgi:transcriptional regulator with XRE-family HTH domain
MQEFLSVKESGPFGTICGMTQAERIIYVRGKVLGLSQIALAAKLGVRRGAISNWERGGGISSKNLKALALLAKTSLDWLVSEIGERPRPGLNSEIHDFIAAVAIREAESRRLDLRELSASMLERAIAKAIGGLHTEAQPQNRDLHRPSNPPAAPSKSKKPYPPKTS